MSDPWWEAVCAGDVETVRQMIEVVPYKLMARDGLGRICLHYAVENNDVGMVSLLCQFRHLVDTPDDCDHTPLHEACYYGRVECAQLLLAAGANPSPTGIDGKTPMMNACRSNSLAIVKLLANFGAHWDEKEVRAACARDRVEIVEWMVAHGFPSPESMFPVCVRSRARRTALWFLDKGIKVSMIPEGIMSIQDALVAGNAKFARTLIERIDDVNATDEMGRTLLMFACQANDSELVQWLVDRGAQLDTVCNGDWSAFSFALVANAVECILILVQAGFVPTAEMARVVEERMGPFHLIRRHHLLANLD